MAFAKVSETTFIVPLNSSSFDVTLPGTVLEDDIVIYAHSADSHITTGVTTSGYTDIHTSTATDAPGFESGYKIMGATPDTVINFNQTGDGDEDTAGVIQVWRGQDLTTPEDATPTNASSGTGMPNVPSITTNTANALVFAIGFLDDDDVASSVTAPSGYTKLLAADIPDASGNATTMIASKLVVSAGAEDPGVFGGSGTDAWEAATFALRQAAAGGDIDLTPGAATLALSPATPSRTV